MTDNITINAISQMPADGNPTYLFVMLHGWGANYQDLAPLAQILNLPEFGYLCPNAPYEHYQMPGGRAWYALEKPEFDGLVASRQSLREWLLSLENTTGVPLKRTIMAGFSQGGAMTLDVGLTLPLAALCSLSGYLHYQPQPNDNIIAYPPALIVHGIQDPIVPLAAAKKARDELTKLSVSVQYREFEMGHEIQPPAIECVKKFVLSVISDR
ncbi:alpha/beta hydrolase [Myxosarcina sp. GI1]|uniref:alpha/beta hydrolase n=1 Tax=Myxosarcina sp. GI1 TaxID=1541065 RepID=UPI00155A7460|nr:alpha/beta hydrolase [Myxosarcina sp. GI1]